MALRCLTAVRRLAPGRFDATKPARSLPICTYIIQFNLDVNPHTLDPQVVSHIQTHTHTHTCQDTYTLSKSHIAQIMHFNSETTPQPYPGHA